MSEPNADLLVKQAFNGWLHEQILKLSVEALNVGAVTCTACAKSASGEYVLEYCGIQFRYSTERTYAFLHFVLHRPVTLNPTTNCSILLKRPSGHCFTKDPK